MLDGCMYGVERTVYKQEDISEKCKFELGTIIEFGYTNIYKKVLKDRTNGGESWIKGKVVGDYEHYIILESPSGYRYCLDKVDIATRDIRVKGFEPGIKEAFAVDYRI